MDILIILLLILLNGVLSMTEMAFVSSRKYRQKADDRFLSTIQIGITLIAILTGLFSGETLTDNLAAVLARWEPLANQADWISKVLIVTVVTYLTLVIGELVPKRIGLMAADKVAGTMSALMKLLRKITYPIVWLLSKSTRGLLVILGMGNMKEAKVTEEEIKALIEEGKEDGEIREVEQELVERVFNLGDRTIETVMTHRSDLIWLDINDPIEMNRDIVQENRHGIYPVADEDLDQLLGVVYLKDLIGSMDRKEIDLRSVI